ncbi:MAG: hypothetical protein Tsb0014_32940 [Pleurocapsa sp.]
MSQDNISHVSIMQKANLIRRQSAYQLWHRQKSQSYILRTQLGFNRVKNSRPDCCIGCINYHGQGYGSSQATRNFLVCGFHPYGWTASVNCPDWEGDVEH